VRPEAACELIVDLALEAIPDEMMREASVDILEPLILGCLGHRWPLQVEAREPVPEWVDPDGIIPLTESPDHERLVARVRERWQQECPKSNVQSPKSESLARSPQSPAPVPTLDAQVEELFEEPLETWLATEFFEHHTKQFKRRPIAWQIQSGPFTAKRTSAFAALLYYHRLDADLLPKLRTQYVGPLAQRLATELRGLSSIAPDSRSDRQAARIANLSDATAELAAFYQRLAEVEQAGFGPAPLLPALRQYAIDDAMLSLKRAWLRRLADMLRDGVLNDWAELADQSLLHADLGRWIYDSVGNLPHHCAKVGPPSPDQAKFAEDPTAADLARLIDPAAAEMVRQSVSLACRQWRDQVDEVVIAPLKEEIKGIKQQVEAIDTELASDPPPEVKEAGKLKLRKKELQAEIKRLNKEVKEKNAAAAGLQQSIEQSVEPGSRHLPRASWPLTPGSWLAEQPLYDNVASLTAAGRRRRVSGTCGPGEPLRPSTSTTACGEHRPP
jgi:hypothetical protein